MFPLTILPPPLALEREGMTDISKGDILIVDDQPEILRAMGRMLKNQGYKVTLVPSGRLALRALEHSDPDLILLDINMPGMNGYEMCEQLKADERFANVPVIFLSGLADSENKVKAFDSGGVDFVAKPFQFKEVIARVETHLRIARLQKDLSERYERLGELGDLKDSLTHMIVHDLRSPLLGILTSLELLEEEGDGLSEKSAEDLQRALRSAQTLMKMITALLDVSRMEAGQMTLRRKEGDLAATAKASLEFLSGLVSTRNVSLEADEGGVRAEYDHELTGRIVANLVSNALKFTPEQGSVTVRVQGEDGRARVEVQDEGPGIPEEYRDKIFEKFGQVDPQENSMAGTGVGLAFCKLAVEAHGGRIGVDSVMGEGSTFWFELPTSYSARIASTS